MLIISSFPVFACPHCDQASTFILDDYQDFEVGDYFECPKCERNIYIHSLNPIIECALGTEPPWEKEN